MHKFAAALILSLGMAAVAHAEGAPPPPSWWVPPKPVHRAPEIDPAGAMAGLTLLAGGLAVLRSRRRGGK